MGCWDWDRAAVPPQCSVLGSGSGEAAEPVSSAEGTVLAAVTGVWMEQSLSQQCWSRLSPQDTGFLNQSSTLLVAQMYTEIFTSLRHVNKDTKT